MPRETLLAAFDVPPPNAYGLAQITPISTAATAYARLRNLLSASPIFLSRIHVKPRIFPYMRVEVLASADVFIDTAGVLTNWLNQQRAGIPAANVFKGERTLFPFFTEIYGSFEIGPGSHWIHLPVAISPGISLVVQAYHTGTMDATFFWFEP